MGGWISVSVVYFINFELNVMIVKKRTFIYIFQSFCFTYVGTELCQSVGKLEGKNQALLGEWSVSCAPAEMNSVIIE
jgi:hypothetical protein